MLRVQVERGTESRQFVLYWSFLFQVTTIVYELSNWFKNHTKRFINTLPLSVQSALRICAKNAVNNLISIFNLKELHRKTDDGFMA